MASFSIKNKEKRSCFFEEIFLSTNIYLNITLEILFFILKNIEIDFIGHHIHPKTYTVAKILLTMKQFKLIRKKKFTATALDLEDKYFEV